MSTRFRPLRPNLPILDADDGIMLRVTPQMCKDGIRNDPCNCALALAAKAEMRGLRQVQVFTHVAYFEFKDRVERFRNSSVTAGMIREFDRRNGVFVPGDYRFLPMNPAWRHEAKAEKNRTKGRPSTGNHPEAGERMRHTAFIRPRGSEPAD